MLSFFFYDYLHLWLQHRIGCYFTVIVLLVAIPNDWRIMFSCTTEIAS